MLVDSEDPPLTQHLAACALSRSTWGENLYQVSSAVPQATLDRTVRITGFTLFAHHDSGPDTAVPLAALGVPEWRPFARVRALTLRLERRRGPLDVAPIAVPVPFVLVGNDPEDFGDDCLHRARLYVALHAKPPGLEELTRVLTASFFYYDEEMSPAALPETRRHFRRRALLAADRLLEGRTDADPSRERLFKAEIAQDLSWLMPTSGPLAVGLHGHDLAVALPPIGALAA